MEAYQSHGRIDHIMKDPESEHVIVRHVSFLVSSIQSTTSDELRLFIGRPQFAISHVMSTPNGRCFILYIHLVRKRLTRVALQANTTLGDHSPGSSGEQCVVSTGRLRASLLPIALTLRGPSGGHCVELQVVANLSRKQWALRAHCLLACLP